jgi:hypothetical protein
MMRIIATNDITDDNGNTVIPEGTILKRQGGVYSGRNKLTGFKIAMDASWADDEVYKESFEMINLRDKKY